MTGLMEWKTGKKKTACSAAALFFGLSIARTNIRLPNTVPCGTTRKSLWACRYPSQKHPLDALKSAPPHHDYIAILSIARSTICGGSCLLHKLFSQAVIAFCSFPRFRKSIAAGHSECRANVPEAENLNFPFSGQDN